MKQFKSVLTKRGEIVFKGGNIEVMKLCLISFKSENTKKAEKHFYKHLCETIGSGSEYLFKITEVK